MTSYLSRTGASSTLGKLNAELPKQRISMDTLDGLQALETKVGMPLAEYVRTVLDCHVHGADHVAMMAAERVRRVAGMGGPRGG